MTSNVAPGDPAAPAILPAASVEPPPAWASDGRDWPHRESSRFVRAAGLRWHVQRQGQGPVALLIHGTGAANHSWRGLLPLLARDFTLVAPDLPGHGFTDAGPQTLPGMAAALASLLQVLDVRPALAVGHSAGAAIAIRMVLDAQIAPAAIVSLNGALVPFRGLPGTLFGPAARLLARSRLLPELVAWRARDPATVDRLLGGTGSTLDATGTELYRRLVRRPGQVAAALGMMANWDLAPLFDALPNLTVPLTLVVGGADRMVGPHKARLVKDRLPGATILKLRGLGHLAHEERPDLVAPLIMQAAAAAGLSPAAVTA